MKLELGYIQISDIQFSKECKVENGTLYVDADAVKAFMYEEDDVKDWVADFKFDIARPGESVRITPVKDVIEPRVKVEGGGGIFPGVVSKVDTVGSGKTHVLRGMAVVTAGKIVGFQEGIIDMSGPGAQYTPFSKLNNFVVVAEPKE
ncbi:MAG: beta-aspartyl-peptidase, partial [Clostridia bacterium]|nr:beta-aspartyl-peptidase [Clostridia bacterium]